MLRGAMPFEARCARRAAPFSAAADAAAAASGASRRQRA